MPPTFRLAVIGDPVAHSKSPMLHTAFLADRGLAGSYEAIRVTLADAGAQLASLLSRGYHGLNITTPLKETVLAHLCGSDPLVREIEAVNTLIATPGGWYGANTDGIGAVTSIRKAIDDANVVRGGSRQLTVLLLGAGPTARAAAVALRDDGFKVRLWNRTSARSWSLAEKLKVGVWQPGDDVDAAFSTLPPDPSLTSEIVSAMLAAPVCIDANYGQRATLKGTLGRPVIDGTPMLAAQAEASFARWLEAAGVDIAAPVGAEAEG